MASWQKVSLTKSALTNRAPTPLGPAAGRDPIITVRRRVVVRVLSSESVTASVCSLQCNRIYELAGLPGAVAGRHLLALAEAGAHPRGRASALRVRRMPGLLLLPRLRLQRPGQTEPVWEEGFRKLVWNQMGKNGLGPASTREAVPPLCSAPRAPNSPTRRCNGRSRRRRVPAGTATCSPTFRGRWWWFGDLHFITLSV